MSKAKAGTPLSRRERIEDRLVAGFVGALHLFPYRYRVPAAGWLMAHVIAPLTGMRRRIARNLVITSYSIHYTKLYDRQRNPGKRT